MTTLRTALITFALLGGFWLAVAVLMANAAKWLDGKDEQ